MHLFVNEIASILNMHSEYRYNTIKTNQSNCKTCFHIVTIQYHGIKTHKTFCENQHFFMIRYEIGLNVKIHNMLQTYAQEMPYMEPVTLLIRHTQTIK